MNCPFGDLKNASYFFSILLSLAQILALAIGALFAYLKWFRGRVLNRRLEIDLQASIVSISEKPYLLISVALRNSGISSVTLLHDGTVVRIYKHQSINQHNHIEWIWLYTSRVFDDHDWIEGSESIRDQVIVPLSMDPGPYKVELNVTNGKQAWKAKQFTSPSNSMDYGKTRA